MLIYATSATYDRRTITLHWLSALAVLMLWSLGQTIDWFPKGFPRTTARSLHIMTGALLGILICYRAIWRRTSGRRLPPADQGGLRLVASLMHVALYTLLFVTVILGIGNAWIRGDTVFDLLTITPMDPGNKPLRDTIGNLHGLAADTLIVLAAIHACAGLTHHFIWRDDVLHRMIPRMNRP